MSGHNRRVVVKTEESDAEAQNLMMPLRRTQPESTGSRTVPNRRVAVKTEGTDAEARNLMMPLRRTKPASTGSRSELGACMHCGEEALVSSLVVGCEFCFMFEQGLYHQTCMQDKSTDKESGPDHRNGCGGCGAPLIWKYQPGDFGPAVQEDYKKDREEQEIRFIDRTYCHDVSCKKFIGNVSNSREAICPACYKSTCPKCKQAAHPYVDLTHCKSLVEQAHDLHGALLRDAEGWKLCPACARPVKKRTPMDGQICTQERCWTHFCWGCEGLRGRSTTRGPMRRCPANGHCTAREIQQEIPSQGENNGRPFDFMSRQNLNVGPPNTNAVVDPPESEPVIDWLNWDFTVDPPDVIEPVNPPALQYADLDMDFELPVLSDVEWNRLMEMVDELENEPAQDVTMGGPENDVMMGGPEKAVKMEEPEKAVKMEEPEEPETVTEPEKVHAVNRRRAQSI